MFDVDLWRKLSQLNWGGLSVSPSAFFIGNEPEAEKWQISLSQGCVASRQSADNLDPSKKFHFKFLNQYLLKLRLSWSSFAWVCTQNNSQLVYV